LFNGIDPIDYDGTLLGLWGKQFLIESVHGAAVVLHDIPGVIVSAYNPHVSCLGMLVLDERSLPSHVIDWLTHGAKIRGKKGGETFACTPLLT